MGYSWKQIRLSLKMFRNQELFDKQKGEIEQLIELDKNGYIDLYFGDESHFSLIANIPYAWQEKNHPILLPSKKSQKLGVFGFMNIKCKLYSETIIGGFNSLDIISCINQFILTITKRTILILGNLPIHKSKAFKNKIKDWKKQDLHIYFLPSSSPELN